jgi:hypothetical protein
VAEAEALAEAELWAMTADERLDHINDYIQHRFAENEAAGKHIGHHPWDDKRTRDESGRPVGSFSGRSIIGITGLP